MPPPILSKAAKDGYHILSIEEKIVADYLSIPVLQIEELDCFEYWAYLRDAVIFYHRQTEEGQKLLFEAWQREQTKPDIQKLKKMGMQKLF